MNEASKPARFTAAEIAKRLEGEVRGDTTLEVTGFAAVDAARKGDLTFAENDAYFARAEKSAASAILVAGDFKSATKTLIHVANARVAFARVLPLFFPEPQLASGVHHLAVIHPSAQVDASAHIGPFCILGERVRVGAQVVLEGGNHIGADTQIGEAARLFPNVTVYPRSIIGRRVRIHAGTVVGSDGFGYVLEAGQHLKVPQVGNVVIHDDVEIGANVTIDRGTLGSTIIGKGAKIDNLVQIAHNVIVGEYSILVAQVGIAGSTQLGKYVTLAGQVGLAGHIKIGDKVTIAAQSGVMDDIPEEEKWFGSPARPAAQVKRQFLAIEKLPELLRRVKEIERRLEKDGGT